VKEHKRQSQITTERKHATDIGKPVR